MYIEGKHRHSGQPQRVYVPDAIERACVVRYAGGAEASLGKTIDVLGRLVAKLVERGLMNAEDIVEVLDLDDLNEIEAPELKP